MSSSKTIRNIKYLIWLYFWLLLFEGAFRKWIVPQLSTPLLIVRDPVVIGAYFLAFKAGLFPKNLFTKLIIVVGFISLSAGLFTVITAENNLAVTIFGFRTNFLHLPLIFLVPKVFDLDDVKKLGKWVLLLAAPMAILMIFQFNSSPDAFINRGAGIEGMQIESAGGKIRPPGTFSFITGAAQYFSLVTSFLVYGLVQSKIYPNWLLSTAGLSIVLALAISGSRSAIGSVITVLISLMVALLIKPSLIGKSYKFIVLAAIVAFGVGYIPTFNQGLEVLNARVETANDIEADQGGIFGRFFDGFLEPFQHSEHIPLLGYGLGMGTNAGAGLLTGKAQFLLAEGEWARVVFESGLFIGVLYLLIKTGLVVLLGQMSAKSAFSGNTLPLLIFGSCAINILLGQIGQPTSLGFAALGGGLCLAACQSNHQQIQLR